MSGYIAPRSHARTFMQWMAGVLVAMLAIGGFGAPAFAAGGNVTLFPIQSESELNGTPVLEEGGTYTLEFGYGSMDDGAVVAITLPDGITIPDDALVVPSGNTGVESLAMNGAGQLVVTFADPFPAGVNQGSLGVNFTVDDVETSEERELVWSIDGVETTQTVIVTTPEDTPQETVTGSDKTVAGVAIPHSLVDGTVIIDAAALDVEIPYTVTISNAEARDVTLTDTLGPNLAFVEGSLAGSKVVRNANGLNPVESALTSLPAISGTGFTHSFAAEANSVYTFTYKAKIADAAALDAIRDQLQAAHDAVDPVNGGDYTVELTNSADVNGEKHSTNTTIRGNVAGAAQPGTDDAFSKSADPIAVTLDEGLEAGQEIADGLAVTYTLGADLTAFADFADGPFSLTDRNVVIRDTLPLESSWNVDADDFIVLADQGGIDVALTPATGVTGDFESEMAADIYVNTYFIDGSNLFVNIGNDVTKTYTLKVKATIDSLPTIASVDTLYQTEYRVNNDAYFVWAEGRYTGKGASTTITVPKDTSGGIDDSTRFSKTTPDVDARATAGESTLIPYTFTVGANIGDAASSRIVDVIDHTVFDVTDDTLASIQASITGAYDENFPLDGDTFDLSIDSDGNLVITPNAAFPKDATGGESAEAPFTGTWNITLELPTQVLEGKQTLELNNAARYEGADDEIVYTSGASTRATSYGDELEVRKNVYDAENDAFTTNLRAAVDAEGDLVQSEFIYRVELMPHGSFSNMVQDVVDVLPAGVEFVGFVAPEDVVAGETTAGDSYLIPGSAITVVRDGGTVTVERGRLVVGETLPLYFKVRVTDFTANVGITNQIGPVGATITPTNDYPLSLLKRDSTDETKLITDSDARFSVLADDQETVVLSDLRVVDGKIVTVDGETPVVAEIGTYWLREDVAPAGYEKATELSEITVDELGGSADVVLFNTPDETVEPEKNYAIGDFVWIDTDKDGQQDEGEQVLPGVTVELLQGDEVISTTTTDDRGRYIFDELPAGEYVVKFTLTDAQSEVYTFTQQDAGDDDAVDSDADTQTGLTRTIVLNDDNAYLTHEYEWNEVLATEGIDPTWDAGVILRDYAIGDVVWIDANKDGLQDSSEQVLPGVTVELLQGDEVISTTTTDERGRYIFDELPSGEYVVKFTLTDEQKKIYAFTQQDAGDDDAIDSDADTETGLTRTIVLNSDNAYLTHEYEWNEVLATEGIDPTWDAGVIVIVPDEPEPSHPGTPGVNELPHTGGTLPVGLAGGALVLLLAGAAFLFWRRRRTA